MIGASPTPAGPLGQPAGNLAAVALPWAQSTRAATAAPLPLCRKVSPLRDAHTILAALYLAFTALCHALRTAPRHDGDPL